MHMLWNGSTCCYLTMSQPSANENLRLDRSLSSRHPQAASLASPATWATSRSTCAPPLLRHPARPHPSLPSHPAQARQYRQAPLRPSHQAHSPPRPLRWVPMCLSGSSRLGRQRLHPVPLPTCRSSRTLALSTCADLNPYMSAPLPTPISRDLVLNWRTSDNQDADLSMDYLTNVGSGAERLRVVRLGP